MIGGLALLAVFVVIELRTKEPMFRLSLFRIRAFTFGNIATLLASLGRGGLMFMLIIWLQGIWLPLHGYSFSETPLWAGVYMLPLTVGFLVAGPASGWLSDHFGARPFATGGMLIAALSFYLLEQLPVNFSYTCFAGLLLLVGHRHGPVRLAQPGRDHEQPAAQPARRRRRHGDDLPELGAGALDRHLLLADDPRPGRRAAVDVCSTAWSRRACRRPTPSASRTCRRSACCSPRSSGYNPMHELLGPSLQHLTAAQAAHLTGRSYFPGLISHAFSEGLHEAFDFAIGCCLVAAAASWFRGGRYVHDVHAADAPPVESLDGELALASDGD